MKMRKKVLIIAVCTVVLFALFLLSVAAFLLSGQEDLKGLQIQSIPFESLEDGVYTSIFSSGRWSNTVEVTVENNKVTKIEIKNDVLFKRPEVTQELINQVIEKQSLEVDTITGATLTCNAYLKSIENALNKE